MTLLQVDNLAKSFGGVRAVRGVSFTVEPGEVVALIGPNGAGKSTCFNLLMGQLRPDAGRIALAGRDITGWQPRRVWRLGVGRTFQIPATFASMTVAENVELALLSRRWRHLSPFRFARRRARDEAAKLLGRLRIAHLARQSCATLAYGDVKRVELAMALANEPKLLLMDEPTAGMAPRERAQLMTQVAELAEETGVAVLFVEHDMESVFAHADRVLVLHRGSIISEGTPGEVRGDRQVQAIYLGGGFALSSELA